jgi:hypothetical protein
MMNAAGAEEEWQRRPRPPLETGKRTRREERRGRSPGSPVMREMKESVSVASLVRKGEGEVGARVAVR